MIEKVLSSLDASSNKYWTLSENQELLFVKDVTETNKYKGFRENTKLQKVAIYCNFFVLDTVLDTVCR